MGQPYVGEIRIFAGNFAPAGWMFCEGQLLPISESDTLFNLIGTTYGGDGQSTFALPDLRGRVPIHQGNGFSLAEAGGVENVTLTQQQLVANDPSPQNNVLGESSAVSMYQSASPTSPMAHGSVGSVGGSQPHDNFQPYLCVDFIISLFGIFPSQT